MSVALATAMDSNYGLRLGLAGHHHLQHLHDLHQALLQQHHHHRFQPYQIPSRHNHDRSTSECSSSPSPSIEDNQPQNNNNNNPSETSPLKFSMINILRPDFGREAILSCPRQQQQSTHQSRSVTPRGDNASRSSPGVLSRSASLESLASNRSSLAGGGATPSICSSAASTVGAESATSDGSGAASSLGSGSGGNGLFPAWIYCTRYSDRPSSGPRSRRIKRSNSTSKSSTTTPAEDKRPRTAFSAQQLAKLRKEFEENRYLNEQRRKKLSNDLGLNEAQIKIWFQNKRAKIKKASGQKNPLAIQLMAQGLYNHSTVPVDENGEEILPENN